jgi:hypothetical protein
MRNFDGFQVESMTDEEFSMLEHLLKSFHDFLQQVLGVLFTIQPPHTNNDLIKTLRPNRRLNKADLIKWRLDPEHGLLHGIIMAYFAVKLAVGWKDPKLRDNADLQRLIASCLVRGYSKVADGGEPHDEELRQYFHLLCPEAYLNGDTSIKTPLVQADRFERLQCEDAWLNLDKILKLLPHEIAQFEVWAFYKFIRPALAKIFRGRTEVWLRHGAEEADWRERWPHESMASRSKAFWPNFFYCWPNFPEYWAIEVGEITASFNKPHLVDYFFPSGLITVDEYRASVANASILSATGREHEIAYGKIALDKWIFVFEDNQLPQDRYLVTNSGGSLTFPIFTNIIDVADGLYSKLSSIGS